MSVADGSGAGIRWPTISGGFVTHHDAGQGDFRDFLKQISGTTKTSSDGGFGSGFAERDVLYCFNNSSGSCTPPFPDDSLLGFYVQFAEEEPGFGSLQGIGEFTDLGIKPYASSHRYEYAWTGHEGKLWLTAYPSNFPGDGIDYTGACTVEIFRD